MKMSFLDRIAAAVTPTASEEQRADARRKADELAASEMWLATILQQHREIESLVAAGLSADGAEARLEAVRDLQRVLTGHSTAEEAVLYPDISEYSSKLHAGMAYEEHAMTKVQLAKLEKIDPLSVEWLEKLEHIQGALQQHMYQEEDSWLPNLVQNLPAAEKARMEARFIEEYERYCGTGSAQQRAGAGPVPGVSATF
jgi:hemerythrin superfamily protein